MARADRAVAPGMVFVPFAYVEAAANLLTNPAIDPYGKIPEFKFCAVRVEPARGRGRRVRAECPTSGAPCRGPARPGVALSRGGWRPGVGACDGHSTGTRDPLCRACARSPSCMGPEYGVEDTRAASRTRSDRGERHDDIAIWDTRAASRRRPSARSSIEDPRVRRRMALSCGRRCCAAGRRRCKATIIGARPRTIPRQDGGGQGNVPAQRGEGPVERDAVRSGAAGA